MTAPFEEHYELIQHEQQGEAAEINAEVVEVGSDVI
jgi:hypothetical protein